MSARCFVGKIEPDTLSTLRRAFEWIRWTEIVRAGARVFIKPNFTIPQYKVGISTPAALLEPLVVLLKERTESITICESNGGLNGHSADQAFAGHGIADFPSRYGVRLLNLTTSPARRVMLPSRKATIEVPEVLFEESVCLITVPVLKTHMMTTVTFGLKNLWGCIPNPRRNLYHPHFREAVAELAKLLKPRISVVDATWGLDGQGPMAGTPRRLDSLVVSQGLASEVVSCRVMGIDFASVRYLVEAQRKGLIPPESEIVLNQPVESFGFPKFQMRRDLVAWGAALLFRSRKLSEWAYYSPLSKIKTRIAAALRGQPDNYV